MRVFRRAAGLVSLCILQFLVLPVGGRANGEFPFDRELILDVDPMRPVKRVPIMAVAPDGAATIDLWCQTVNARVTFAGDTVRIELGPIPDALPAMMAAGQCAPERRQADASLLADLAQVESWKQQGDKVLFGGPKALRFRLSSH